MDEDTPRRIRWLFFPVVIPIVFCGCAQHSTDSLPIARQARDVAARRLAVAGGIASDHPIAGVDHAGGKPSRGLEQVVTRLVADAVLQDKPGEQAAAGAAGQVAPLAEREAVEPDSVHPEKGGFEKERATAVARGPLGGFFDTVKRDIRETPRLLWHDTKAVYGNPWNVLFLVGAGGASLTLRPEVDDDIEDFYDKHHTFSSGWRDGFSVLGNPGTHFAMAGAWYLAGQQLQDAKTYEVGKRLFSALLINGVTTLGLKVAANTEAPNGEKFGWPSGHVSSTMTVATVLNDAYGPLVGIPLFGLTALVGIERLDDREHSFSDLVFGAALGWVVAETVVKEHRPEIFGGGLVPYVDPVNNASGLAWVKMLGN